METSGRYEMLSESGFDNGIDIEARYNQIYKIILSFLFNKIFKL